MKSADRWQALLNTARALDEAELRRHASIAISNNHQYVECFVCACVTVQDELEKAIGAKRRKRRDDAHDSKW